MTLAPGGNEPPGRVPTGPVASWGLGAGAAGWLLGAAAPAGFANTDDSGMNTTPKNATRAREARIARRTPLVLKCMTTPVRRSHELSSGRLHLLMFPATVMRSS